MHHFEKDPKKLQKQFYKHYWEFDDETKKSQNQYVSTEVEMWEKNLRNKAKAFIEEDREAPEWMKEYYNQEYQKTQVPTLMQQHQQQESLIKQQNQYKNVIEEQRLLAKMPDDAPQWLQSYHLDFYGNFIRDWQKHLHTDEQGQQIPFWYNAKLNKSTWDSPTMILTAFLQNGIESEANTNIIDWESVSNTPFIKVKLQGIKKKDVKYYYLHRINKVIFKENPLQKANKKEKDKDQNQQEKQEDDQEEEQEDTQKQEEQLNIEIEGEGEGDIEEVEDQSLEIDERLLDPNAFDSDKDQDQSSDEEEEEKINIDQKQKSNEYESQSESGSEDSFELSPEQQFIQDHQKEIAQFKQMFIDKNVGVLNTTWEKELPKVLHDPRYRAIPQNYRKIIYEDYVKNQDIEKQRRAVWEKHKHLKQDFISILDKLVHEGKITADTQVAKMHKLMVERQINKSYDKLYQEDKEFVYSEFMRLQKELKEVQRSTALENFKILIREKLDKSKLNENSKWKEVKNLIKDDKRYQNLKSISLREKLFDEFIMSEVLKTPGQKRDRLIMQNDNSAMIEELDKAEKKRIKKEEKEALDNFKRMLEEKIKVPNISFKEATKILKDDQRFEHYSLNFEKKLDIYKEYMKDLFNKKRKEFRELLEENKGLINPFSTWDNVVEMIQDDPRFKEFPERNRRQTFEQHVEFLANSIKRDFYTMLQQEMGTRLFISKYTNLPFGEVQEELIELLENKDERFRKMGLYYQEERDNALKEEFQKLKL